MDLKKENLVVRSIFFGSRVGVGDMFLPAEPAFPCGDDNNNNNNTSGFGLAVFPAGGGSGSGVGGFGLAVFPAGGGSGSGVGRFGLDFNGTQ